MKGKNWNKKNYYIKVVTSKQKQQKRMNYAWLDSSSGYDLSLGPASKVYPQVFALLL